MDKKEAPQTTLPKKLVGKKVFVGVGLFLALIVVVLLLVTRQNQPGKTTLPTATTPAAPTGNTYYVSKNGNNADGSSWATAWNELGNINWDKVQPGDTILIDGGKSGMIYSSTLTIPKSGTADAPITIKMASDAGRNGQVKIFGGRNTPLPYCGQAGYNGQNAGVRGSGIDFGSSAHIIVDGTKWDGLQVYGHSSDGVEYNGASDITLRNAEIFDNGSISGSNTDRPGVHPVGTNLVFDQVNVHDNGQDGFQTGGPVNNFTLRHSWLHNARSNPSQGANVAFNYPCTHEDGIQIYSGGTQKNFLIEDSVFGPGLMQGLLLGDNHVAPTAVLDNVTIRNDLFIQSFQGTNIMGYRVWPSREFVNDQHWTIDHITSYTITGDQVIVGGTGHQITNSVFYGGKFDFNNPLAASSGNCLYKTSGKSSYLAGKTVDPRFVSNVDSYTASVSLDALGKTNFSLQSSSPCQGKGSSMRSVAQLISSAKSSSQPSRQRTSAPTSPLSAWYGDTTQTCGTSAPAPARGAGADRSAWRAASNPPTVRGVFPNVCSATERLLLERLKHRT